MNNETEAVCVFCRLKPLNDENIEPCIIKKDDSTISTRPPEGCRRNTKELEFTFTKVFDGNCTQQDVFIDFGIPLIDNLAKKKNGLLFAYGVTGSGKTYTMQGTNQNPGIVARSIKRLFRRLRFIRRYRIIPDGRNGFKSLNLMDSLSMIEKNRYDYSRRSGNHECKSFMSQICDDTFEIEETSNCTVFISMVEICGNNIKDLLLVKNEPRVDVTIKEDRNNNKYLHNVKQIEVQKSEEALYWYLQGQKNRKTAATNLNNQSSRSHCVFLIRLVRLDGNKGDDCDFIGGDGVTVNQLALVDLAGSERSKRTGTTGAQLKEASDINNSLMELQTIMKMLREKQKENGGNSKTFINYRANGLTHLFKTSFEGGSSVRMIVCAQQMPSEYDETLNVLSFAEEAKEVRIIYHDNLYTPKTNRIMKTSATVSTGLKTMTEPPDEYEYLCKMDQELDKHLQMVERYRMIHPDELRNSDEMMRVMLMLLNILSDITTKRKQIYDILPSANDEVDEEERLENEHLKLTLKSEKIEKTNLKRRLKEVEAKNEEHIRSLEDQLKESRRQNEELESRLKQKKLNDLLLTAKPNRDSMRVNPSNSVKILAKKFEEEFSNSNKTGSIISSSSAADNTTMSSQKRVIVNPLLNKKGYFNRYYRRSKVKGELFVEHKEKNEIPSSTLHKLNIKRRRSSAKIDLDDLKKSNKYILQHQTVTNDRFQVDFHEGDLIPTAGGGVAMCFTNIETVTQQSPFGPDYSRKRPSSVPSEIDDEPKKYKEEFS